jgi:hypothetical protein
MQLTALRLRVAGRGNVVCLLVTRMLCVFDVFTCGGGFAAGGEGGQTCLCCVTDGVVIVADQ